MAHTIRPSGPVAWLVETDDVLGFDAAIRAGAARAGLDVVEIVPAARTVLVSLARPDQRDAARDWLATLAPRPTSGPDAGRVEIPVRYDGDDLDDVAEATGLSVEAVIERHTAGEYQSAFCGFAPGFAYLGGLDPALVLPRRDTPRTRVPAGSVAIAAGYTAVYPDESPGGWHLLGRTEVALWDLERDPPATLAPGTVVRFVAVP